MKSSVFVRIFSTSFTLLMVLLCIQNSQATEEEKTYDISLEKTAEIGEDIRRFEDKKVLTETLTIKKGEWVWKILREKGLLKKRNLPQLLSVLKKLNKSFQNLDLVHPGQKIIVPLKIVPLAGGIVQEAAQPEKVIPVAALKDLNFENYSVRPGDSLTRVAKGRYADLPEDSYREYLDLVKKLNPSIKNLDLIFPGQVVKLPIYSPETVRKKIESPIPKKPQIREREKEEVVAISKKQRRLLNDLGMLFAEMGEEWVQTGRHFIPLKSGGQIDLQAKSFPVINLRNGLRIIVDMNNRVPEKMASLINSSWGNYRVVHIAEGDDLSQALDKILRMCDYPKIFKSGEVLELKGDIGLKIAGDWIITLSRSGSDKAPSFLVINLKDKPETHNAPMIREYLKDLGVKVIEYPPVDEDNAEQVGEAESIEGGGDPSTLIKKLLTMAGRNFSTRVKIPVYQSKKADFKLIITADYLLKVKGKDAIIALTDLGPEVISFLREHQFLVLSLVGEKDPLTVVEKTLEFLGVRSDHGPHDFMAAKGNDSRNITLSLPGCVFSDRDGKSVLATTLSLPHKIAVFLSQRGYRILFLSFS